MAFNVRFPDGRDFELVIPRRTSAPTSFTGVRGPDGQDAAMWFEKYNGVGSLPTANVRNTSAQDFSLVFASVNNIGVDVNNNEVSFNNGSSTTPVNRTLTTGLTCTASGGSGVYTYFWEIVSQSNTTGATLGTNGSSTIQVSATVGLNLIGTVTVRCTVTSSGITGSDTGVATFNYFNNV